MTLEIAAELSCNHLGSLHRALQIVDAAADAGADLFKVQVWEPDMMCLDRGYRLESGPWAGRTLFDLYREAWTPWDWLPQIFERARRRGMEPFGAAFDTASVDYLESLGVKRHKVASFELVDLPLIRYMASKDKPVILSTGMATEMEVNAALAEALASRRMATVLHCVSAYPAQPDQVDLQAMVDWSDRIDVGISDHTPGIGVAVAAVALGARYVEKHLTLRRADGGPDAGFSLEPEEFKALVAACRQAHAAVQPRTEPPAGENPALRRSLYVAIDTPAGQPLRLGLNVRTARPAQGLPCNTALDNRRAARDLFAGRPLLEEDVA